MLLSGNITSSMRIPLTQVPDLKCGVLTDFDLFILQWELRVIGTDRTVTIPCMAIDQLTCQTLIML